MTNDPKSFTKIVINGQEIGPDKIPDFLRKFVVDADGNGVPDFLDQMFKNPLFKTVLVKAGDHLKTQLQTMKNLTPEQQTKIKALLEKLDTAGMTGNAGTSISVTTSSSGFRPSSTPTIDYRKLGLPDPEQKDSLLSPFVIGLLTALAAAGVAAWYFMRG